MSNSNNRNVFFKNLPELLSSLENSAVQNAPNADVVRNSPFHDVAIQPQALELSIVYEQLKNIMLDQSPFTTTQQGLVRLARNQNLLKKGPISAVGLITVSSKILPNTNIPIPAGTKFSTPTGKQVITLTNAVIPALANLDYPNGDYTVSPYFFINENAKSVNDSGERFGVDIPVITVGKGSTSEIEIGQISQIVGTPIAGIDEITNRTPIKGGLDEEGFFGLQTRLLLSKRSRQIGAAAAYKARAMDIITVKDALVVQEGDPLMQRDLVRGLHIGGKVDVYVIGQEITQTTQRNIFQSNASLGYSTRDTILFEKQPVISITSVVGDVDGQFPTSAYSLQKDNGPWSKNSTNAQDRLVFSSDFDAKDQDITITYTYNQTLDDVLQQIDYNKSINADVAIFEALLLLVDFSITVRANSGFSKGVVQQDVINALTNLLANYQLGQELKVSQVITLLQNLSSVNEVIIKSTTFGPRDPSTQKIILPAEPVNISLNQNNLQINQYLRAGNITVVVLENN